MANAIHVIVPYRHASTWVFDDPRVGLSQEPFVSGIPEMIDTMVEHIPNAEKGKENGVRNHLRLVRARAVALLDRVAVESGPDMLNASAPRRSLDTTVV